VALSTRTWRALFTGYIVVLKTTGAKSRQIRCAPMNYTIINGQIYCVAGWGRATHWFANLRAHPTVTLLLPGRVIPGSSEEVLDPARAHRAIIKVARNAGMTLLFDGLNPLTATDRQILATNGRMPVVRIRPARPLISGPGDPGGLGCLLPTLDIFTIILAWRRQRRLFSPQFR